MFLPPSPPPASPASGSQDLNGFSCSGKSICEIMGGSPVCSAGLGGRVWGVGDGDVLPGDSGRTTCGRGQGGYSPLPYSEIVGYRKLPRPTSPAGRDGGRSPIHKPCSFQSVAVDVIDDGSRLGRQVPLYKTEAYLSAPSQCWGEEQRGERRSHTVNKSVASTSCLPPAGRRTGDALPAANHLLQVFAQMSPYP